MRTFLLSPFRTERGWHLRLIALYLLINLLVAFNAVHTSATTGYDAGGHQKNIATLATFRLPGPDDSKEFFSPPLPYLFPAGLIAFLRMDAYRASKVAQFLNVLLSLITTFYLLLSCESIRRADGRLKFLSLLGFAVLPVYYKTMSYVRGEPFVVCLAVVAAWLALRIFSAHDYRRRTVVALGLVLGLLALARQWGIFVIPAVALLALLAYASIAPNGARLWLHSGRACSLPSSSAVGIISLCASPTAPRRRSTASLPRNGPSATSRRNSTLAPAMDACLPTELTARFPTKFFPIFYSEIWGDYWNSFVVVAAIPPATRHSTVVRSAMSLVPVPCPRTSARTATASTAHPGCAKRGCPARYALRRGGGARAWHRIASQSVARRAGHRNSRLLSLRRHHRRLARRLLLVSNSIPQPARRHYQSHLHAPHLPVRHHSLCRPYHPALAPRLRWLPSLYTVYLCLFFLAALPAMLGQYV